MKTLKGVIAATTYADYQTPLTESDLFIEPWCFLLSSGIYIIEDIETSAAKTASSTLGYHSKPWKLSETDTTLAATVSVARGQFRSQVLNLSESEYSTAATVSVSAGVHRELVNRHQMEPEISKASGVAVSAGLLRKLVVRYTKEPDETEAGLVSVSSGSFISTNPILEAPDNLYVTDIADGEIGLSWTNSSTIHTAQRVYRSYLPFDSEELPDVLVELAKGVRSYVDEGVEPGTYYYAVSSVGQNGEEFMSAVVQMVYVDIEMVVVKFEGDYIPEDGDQVSLRFEV